METFVFLTVVVLFWTQDDLRAWLFPPEEFQFLHTNSLSMMTPLISIV